MQFRQLGRALILASIAIICSAHIGSPDAWYNGAAGPYQVLVHVKAPAVVPGIAIISIKPAEAVDTVTAFVNKYDATTGAPPPDVARPVADNPGWFRTQLWVMAPGSNTVTVSLRGAKGEGIAVVPLVAVAARRLSFDRLLTVALGAAALILVAGLLTIVGAAVRESVLPPGAEPDAARKKRARYAMMRGAVAVIAVVSGLGFWWRGEDTAFAQNLFKPLAVVARVEAIGNGARQLVLNIADSAWTQRNQERRVRARGGSEFTTLVADHQKLMHMFVIAENGQGAFAHLHPTTTDSVAFTSLLPPLPAGRYRIFADVLHASGFTQTLTTTIDLDASSAVSDIRPTDADDAWIAGVSNVDSATSRLADGTAVTWLSAATAHVAGAEAGLRFSVTPPPGDTASLEPYLEMLGHAAVVRDDGAVFIHLHPMGTISMGAQTLLSRSGGAGHKMQMADSSARDSGVVSAHEPNTLYFPYAFPTTGNYTVWVQMKRHGQVQTAAFRVVVVPETESKSR